MFKYFVTIVVFTQHYKGFQMNKKLTKLIATSCLLTMFHSASNAAFITYTADADFTAATTGAITDTFNDLIAVRTPTSPLIRGLSGGNYEISTADGTALFVGARSFAPSGEEYISNDSKDISISFMNFFSLPVNAISAYLFGSSTTPIDALVTVTVLDINGVSSTLNLDCNLSLANCFFGFTSTDAIESFVVSSSTSFVGLDDLTFANTNSVSVNTPASIALLGLGLFGLYSRRKG
jgi:hypothetical protein